MQGISHRERDRPEGCAYYAEDKRGNRFIVRGALPAPSDALCRALTGHSEAELVRRILAREYDSILSAGSKVP